MVSLEEARKLLWEDFVEMSDEQVRHLVTLIKSVCDFVISTDNTTPSKK
jgi:hypothetical protein